MADITYGVSVEYLSSGNISVPTSNIDKSVAGFNSMKSAISGVNGVLDTVIGGLFNLGAAATMAVGTLLAGGFAAALHESIKFNQEMEDTQTGLATLANAAMGLNGAADSKESFGNQYRLAGDVIRQMRKDAQELPGEFKDLQRIMAEASPAGDAAGMGMFDIEKMSAAAMAAAGAMHIPFAQVGRQIGEIIQGNARVTNRTFTGLNLKNSKGEQLAAKDFNKLSQDDRLKSLEAGLAAQKPGLDSVKQNWSTISSNFVDGLKIGVGVVGGPLLDRVKDVMKRFNSSDKSGLQAMGQTFSDKLVFAFDYGYELILKWGPAIMDFVRTLESGFARVFDKVGPVFNAIADKLYRFLGDPMAFHKMEHIAKMLVEARIGGAAMSGAGSAMSAAGAAFGGAEVFAAIGILLPAFIALGVGLYGIYDIFVDTKNKWHSLAMGEFEIIKTAMSGTAESMQTLLKNMQPVVDLLGAGLLTGLTAFVVALDGAALIIAKLTSGLGDKLAGGDLDKVRHKLQGEMDPDVLASNAKFEKEMDAKYGKGLEDTFSNRYMPLKDMDAHLEPAKAAKPPNHTTHIHKVEIKVNSNQDPSRIAKATVGLLKEMARNPKSASINPAGRFNTQNG